MQEKDTVTWEEHAAALARVTRAGQAWQTSIDRLTHRLWETLLGPVNERLKTLDLAPGAPVLIMPQGGLGLVPMHAAWHEVDVQPRYFFDAYTVTYASSGYVLQTGWRRMAEESRHIPSLLAVVNPTGNLPYTPAEEEAVAALFAPQATGLNEAEATPEAVVEKAVGHSYLHLSCHGFYNWANPFQSGLVLADGDYFILADVIADLDLSATRLVTLSACETGITDIGQSLDEYLGLPAGFLQAGAPGVVSTLWAVDDLSTMLLIERFYQLHRQEDVAIAAALREAQQWVRTLTATALQMRFSQERQEHLSTSLRMPAEVVHKSFRHFAAMVPDEKPFAHPFYWAAFTFSGV